MRIEKTNNSDCSIAQVTINKGQTEMKLYDKTEVVERTLSTEEFVNRYSTLNTISQEAITDYFFKIKDSINTATSKLLNLDNDKVTSDALSSKFETLNAIKKIKFSDAADQLVGIPENFKGKYVDYVSVLHYISSEAVESADKTLNTLKMAVSSFINEYSEDRVFTIYGKSVFEKSKANTEARTKKISNFFPVAKSTVKAEIKDVLKSFTDVDVIFKEVKKIDEVINEDVVKQLVKLGNECSELVDALIEHNSKSGIMTKNESAKKELVEAIYVSAKEVEFIGYLYSNVVFFYTAVKKLSETLISISDSQA